MAPIGQTEAFRGLRGGRARLCTIDLTDGGRATITVAYDQLDGVRQLLQFGDHIEIVDPLAARQLLRRLGQAIARAHR